MVHVYNYKKLSISKSAQTEELVYPVKCAETYVIWKCCQHVQKHMLFENVVNISLYLCIFLANCLSAKYSYFRFPECFLSEALELRGASPPRPPPGRCSWTPPEAGPWTPAVNSESCARYTCSASQGWIFSKISNHTPVKSQNARPKENDKSTRR